MIHVHDVYVDIGIKNALVDLGGETITKKWVRNDEIEVTHPS
jgi:hypothetical protein